MHTLLVATHTLPPLPSRAHNLRPPPPHFRSPTAALSPHTLLADALPRTHSSSTACATPRALNRPRHAPTACATPRHSLLGLPTQTPVCAKDSNTRLCHKTRWLRLFRTSLFGNELTSVRFRTGKDFRKSEAATNLFAHCKQTLLVVGACETFFAK